MNTIDRMLTAVRTQVCGLERVPLGEISPEDMRKLYVLAKDQDMAHIVAVELSNQKLLRNGDEISDKFRRQQMIAVFRYERINYELEAICDLFEKYAIPHMPLKGSVMRRYYAQPWMRTSADIDLLVKKEHLETAISLLVEKLEYIREGNSTHDIQMFSPSGVHLELHFDTIEEARIADVELVLADIWNHSTLAEGCKYRYFADDDMFYFYHIAHMAKHVQSGGCGVRFFLDLWILNHKVEFRSDTRYDLIRKGGLLEFAKVVEHLSEVWFSEAVHSDMSRIMAQYILTGGVYGSKENDIILKQIKTGGHTKYVLSRIFLPYDTIKTLYPVLNKHKWLLPACEVRRWCRLVFRGGFKRSVAELKQSAHIKEIHIIDVDTMLKELGLT